MLSRLKIGDAIEHVALLCLKPLRFLLKTFSNARVFRGVFSPLACRHLRRRCVEMQSGSQQMVAFGHRAALTALAAADSPSSATDIAAIAAEEGVSAGDSPTETVVATTAADGVARLWQLTTDASCGSTSAPLLDCRQALVRHCQMHGRSQKSVRCSALQE